MGNENIFTVLVAVLTILGSVIGSVAGVWVFARKNKAEVEKAKGLSDIKAHDVETAARAAEIKERADFIEMIKENGKNSAIWLETLKITEHKRELDYATLKAIIEDGTKETINSRKELLKNVDDVSAQAKEHNTGVTNSLTELKKEFASIKSIMEALPAGNDEIKSRLDRMLGYIERLLPKLRTNEMPIASPPNGSMPEPAIPPA